MKILVYTPLHPAYGIRKLSLESIMALKLAKGTLTFAFERSPMPLSRMDFHDILAKYLGARRMVLEGHYDALLTVEADVVVPELALERLIELNADVAYGLYCSRRIPHTWLIFTDVSEREATRLPRKYRELYFGSAVTTVGMGFGCTLIHRNALEKIPFRIQPSGCSCDWFFALDCQEQGLLQVTDLGVVCGHYLNEHEVIYPDPKFPTGYRTEAV
jgi:hypothetical protein